MEKLSWKQVRHNDRNGALPSLRWGHSCCVIDDEVVYFGGYADSSYMNDVWTFNTITMQWTEIETTGDIPSHRSNCSMNYDRENQRIIVFGGGGLNKRRFNTINILDWKTKEWFEIHPKPNQPAPWERTYHTAELYYPYLVVFGGEGVGDLDDLWIFNFMTLSWTEVLIDKNAVKPCARRFHASAKIGNQMFVIAGCYSKYRCLSDTFSIDFTNFFETGKTDKLVWKERKMKDSTFLTRWGHTSAVYNNKIYVFGGRFCNDLNDILVLDPSRDQITNIKIQGDSPKARRRHSACFLGSSMLIFGGFNGQYFNDLHYINITNTRKKLTVSSNFSISNIEKLKGIKSIEWRAVETLDKQIYQVCYGLLVNRFKSIKHLNSFLKETQGKYTKKQLQQLIMSLYKGYGKVDNELIFRYGMYVCQFKEELDSNIKKMITQEDRQIILLNKRLKAVQPIILLDEKRFSEYMNLMRTEQWFYDICFNVSGQECLQANRSAIALNSQYFANLINANEDKSIINLPINESLLFQTILQFLSTNFVIASRQATFQFWVRLAQLAQYFSLTDLLLICENHLLTKINDFNCQQLLVAALDLNLENLSIACGEQIIKNMVNQDKEDINESFPEIKSELLCLKRERVLKEVYSLLRFDILQRKIDSQEKSAKNSLKKIESDNNEYQQEEKQNFEINH